MNQILYFDDTCRFCNKSIDFLKTRNAKLTYKGISKSRLPKKMHQIDSLILQKKEEYFIYSDAAIRGIASIGGVYKSILIALIIPRIIRDTVYKKIAKKRHCLI